MNPNSMDQRDTADPVEIVEFDEVVSLALAETADARELPRPEVKIRLMSRLAETSPPAPRGFSFSLASDDTWVPHPVPGIRMKVLAMNRERHRATLLLDVEPGTRFPEHHHDGDEECYVISGSLVACGRRLHAGDFHHADAGSDHGELWTDEGCRVLLVVAPEDYMPDVSPGA
jgi:anti-sigma factor ChrR (cupin superfamily)